MKFRIVLFFLLAFPVLLSAQTKYTVSGVVYDKSNKQELLIGAHVIYSSGHGTVTDVEGKFSLNLEPGKYTIEISYVGYEKYDLDVVISNRDLFFEIGLEPVTLDEVVIVADVARSRETPVAFSTITPAKIQEELAAQDIPMLLNRTPGVYATTQGGGDGDAEITIRGFSTRNVGVLLDGVPVNDMENGYVYWSNWFGLDAVTRSIQVQRGLGASKLALPSVGGTINIITKGLDSRKEGSFSQEFGSQGYLRTSFGYNSGPMKNGWGISIAGSYKQGNGWVDQTWTKGFFFYGKIDKKLGRHVISLSAFGAPQSHGQRAYQLPIAAYDSAYAEKLGVKLSYWDGMSAADSLEVYNNRTKSTSGLNRGLTYNQHWGYLARTKDDPNAVSEPFNERINEYFKPQITLKDFWEVNNNIYISNIIYLSIGKGGGIREKASMDMDANGLINFQDLYDRNIGTGTINTLYGDSTQHEAANYLRELVNEHFWYGLLSTINYRPDNVFNFSGGIDLRSYKGVHYEKIYDLLGADYVAPDYVNYSGVDWTRQYPLSDFVLHEGDINYYHNDGLVRWAGLFFQTEFKKDKISSFINLTGALSSYKRVDYFYGLNPVVLVPETDWNNYPGFTVKGGLNYNFTTHLNAFVNLGYLNKAPRFSNVYDRTNTLFLSIENEKIKAIEMGTSYGSENFSVNLNMYYTIWENKPVESARTVAVDMGNGEFQDASVNINGLDALHRGIELDFVFKINRELEIQGLMSIGDWKWNSSDTARVYDPNTGELLLAQYFDATGVHVGNSAQRQFGIQMRWAPIKGFYLKPTFTYFGKYFAEFDPFTVKNGADSWQVPSYGLVDINTGYRYKLGNGNSIQLRFNILNLLNVKYISSATNNDTYNGIALTDFDAKSASVFFGLGRRYNVAVQYQF